MSGQPYKWWQQWLRAALAAWKLLLLGALFLVFLAVCSHYYLMPAAQAYVRGSPEQRKAVQAISLLLLAVVLTLLWLGVLWALRRRR